jgi:hypothetical protein
VLLAPSSGLLLTTARRPSFARDDCSEFGALLGGGRQYELPRAGETNQVVKPEVAT